MEKKDKLTIATFIFLIISILLIVGINFYKNRPLKNIDRKIEYIMGYNSNIILDKGENLFKQTIELLTNKDVFEYAKGNDNEIKYYSINKINNYQKIKNFSIVKNILSESAIVDYMNSKNIINFENSYYIVLKDEEKINYIGSIINIDSCTNNTVTFKSINYYCDNYKYIGLIDEMPNCNYETKETKFNLIYKDNTFRIANVEEFKNIITK